MKTLVLLLLVLLTTIITMVQVTAHSNVLYGVDLDFDKELKQGVVSAAKTFLNVDEDPIIYDYDRELIVVKFDSGLEHSVSINPIDFSISGFRDDSLVKKGEVKFDADERREIATGIFESVANDYKSELVYGGEKKLYSGLYRYIWYRYVNGVYVINDHLEVEIDPVEGEIVSWRLSPFFYLASQMKTTPAINYKVAQKISELEFDAQPLDFNPILIILADKPVWVTKVKSLYPIFVGVDALTGSVVFSGSPRGELPVDYDFGRSVEVVETDFIKTIYNT